MPSPCHRYRAFGLTIHSDVALPELPTADGSPDVVVRLGSCDVPRPADWADGTCYSAAPTCAYLHVDRVGCFAVREQREVIVQPLPDALPYLIASAILGPVISVLLHQRGFLVLHASVVSWRERAVALVGDKAWGKSTLAAALCRHGCSLVSDDVAALGTQSDGAPVVFPAVPHVKLWSDASQAVGIGPEQLVQIDARLKERLQVGRDGFAGEPVPLGLVYVLANRSDEGVEPLSPREAFLELTRHTYPTVAQVIQMTKASGAQFDPMTKLVSTVPVRRLARRPDISAVVDHAEYILSSLQDADRSETAE